MKTIKERAFNYMKEWADLPMTPLQLARAMNEDRKSVDSAVRALVLEGYLRQVENELGQPVRGLYEIDPNHPEPKFGLGKQRRVSAKTLDAAKKFQEAGEKIKQRQPALSTPLAFGEMVQVWMVSQGRDGVMTYGIRNSNVSLTVKVIGESP